jgi:hypothetical protein
MIGTPNGDAPLAYRDTFCIPTADDLKFGSKATQARQNHNDENSRISFPNQEFEKGILYWEDYPLYASHIYKPNHEKLEIYYFINNIVY